MKISKEQVLQLNEASSTYRVNDLITRWFPKAFTELVKTGEWYKTRFIPLFFLEKIDKKNGYGYGIYQDKWADGIGLFIEDLIKISDKEVEKALICEAKNRGFDFEVKFKEIDDIQNGGIWDESGKVGSSFILSTGNLYTYGYGKWCIFKDGKWASVIEQKTPLFTTEDGVKIFEGDAVYVANLISYVGELRIASSNNVYSTRHYRYFSTIDKLKEYLLLNKPLLSLNELLIAWETNEHLQNIDDYKQSPLFNNFKKAAEQKLSEPKSTLVKESFKNLGILNKESINDIETFCTEVKYTIKK